MKNSRAAYLFIAPFVLVFAAFYLVPVGYAVYLSLFKVGRVNGIRSSVFAGFDNYIRAFQDSDFLQSLVNIFVFSIVQIPIMLGVALLLALALDSYKGAALRFFRTVFYLPYTLPTIIAGLLWGYLYSQTLSPFSYISEHLGGGRINFLSGLALFFSIGNIVTWTWTGYNMITMYASLQNISPDIYEAARIDGATNWQISRFIKIPLLRPTLLLTLIFSIIGTSQLFSEPFIIRSGGTYVPPNITPNVYLYSAFTGNNFEYAATLAIILAVITFAFSGIFLRGAGFSGGRR